MATKQKQNRNKSNESEKAEIRRHVNVYLLKDMDVVEFKVWLERDGNEEDTFGGGALKREDLRRVAQELTEYDQYLEICDADQKGYRWARQERNKDQKDYYANDNNDNEQQDNNQDDGEQDDE